MGPANADQLVWMYGKDLEGLDLNFTWGFYSKPGIGTARGGGAHVHPVDEVWCLSVLTRRISTI